ncbi:hypothetical protein MGWOODY_Mmi2025 [hydrothermal vent metagenome]|uniref:Uncharacterized protein n=1 Tax=hydrothermal vent metagenome TaxID=652676 RepID=A0A160VHD1_9ZZZZ
MLMEALSQPLKAYLQTIPTRFKNPGFLRKFPNVVIANLDRL